jgi:hypothetical protein
MKSWHVFKLNGSSFNGSMSKFLARSFVELP